MSNSKKRANIGFGARDTEQGDSINALINTIGKQKSTRPNQSPDTKTLKTAALQSGYQDRGRKTKPPKVKTARVQKNIRPTVDRANKLDFLMGTKLTGLNGAELIDKALDLLFEEYNEICSVYDNMHIKK